MVDKDFQDIIGFILLLLGAAVVIKIIDEATKTAHYKCPRCSGELTKGQNPCRHCYAPIRWKIYE